MRHKIVGPIWRYNPSVIRFSAARPAHSPAAKGNPGKVRKRDGKKRQDSGEEVYFFFFCGVLVMDG